LLDWKYRQKESSAHCTAYGRVCVFVAKCTTDTIHKLYDVDLKQNWFYELVPSRSICWVNRTQIVVCRAEACGFMSADTLNAQNKT